MNPEELNQQFGIENKVKFEEFEHTTAAIIKNQQAAAKISLYGAHVLNYQTNTGDELLFVSPHAVYQEGKAIRGGIPVCWPWFGAHPLDASMPSHGFARTSIWQVVNTSAMENETLIELGLSSNEKTLKLWPYQFEARLIVRLTDKLKVELKTINPDNKPFEVSAALHSYFNISDINVVTLEGLANTPYVDDVEKCDAQQNENLLSFGNRIDRRYRTANQAVIHDGEKKISIEKVGSGITVVWNPGKELAMQMPDLLESYKNMLCVEAANSLDDTITIQPGNEHTLSTTIA